jgi:cell division protease FtsH
MAQKNSTDGAGGPATEPEKLPARAPTHPWRTEGLPTDRGDGAQPPRKKWNWWKIGTRVVLGYLIVFSLVTFQDRLNEAPTIPYSEFNAQVEAGNVAELFARGQTIQGKLRQAKPLPGATEGKTYERFATERPVFAQDDLFSKLVKSGAAVKATPV